MASPLWLGFLKTWSLLSSVFLLAFSSFEENVALACIAGVFTIANTVIALWWANRERKGAAQRRHNPTKHSGDDCGRRASDQRSKHREPNGSDTGE